MPDCRTNELDHATAAGLAELRKLAIAAGRADIAAGCFVTPADIALWVENLGAAYEFPAPQSTLI
jgi:predicted transcriptional regulator